jgi:hypothetical protein
MGAGLLVLALLCLAAFVHLVEAQAENRAALPDIREPSPISRREEPGGATATETIASTISDLRRAERAWQHEQEARVAAQDRAWREHRRALLAASQVASLTDPELSLLLAIESAAIGYRDRIDEQLRREGLDRLAAIMGDLGIPLAIGASSALPRPGETTAARHAGFLLVTRREGGAVVWDLARGVELGRIPREAGVFGEASWSSAGECFRLVRAGGNALCWEPSAGMERSVPEVESIGLRTLATLQVDALEEEPRPEADLAVYLGPSGDGTLHVLNWPTLKAVCCMRAGRNMTSREWSLYMGEDASYRRTCPEFPLERP